MYTILQRGTAESRFMQKNKYDIEKSTWLASGTGLSMQECKLSAQQTRAKGEDGDE